MWPDNHIVVEIELLLTLVGPHKGFVQQTRNEIEIDLKR